MPSIGLGIGINRRRGGGVFSPNALFANGESGDWFDPSDLSRMWQDTAGTTPITADGQSVARIDGQRGVVSLRQATPGSRPLYKTSAGLHWTEHDGTDDALQSAANLDMSAADEITMVFAQRKAADDGQRWVAGSGTTQAGSYGLTAPNGASPTYAATFRGSSPSNAAYNDASVAAPHTAVLTIRGKISTSSIRLNVNGVERATSAASLGTGNAQNGPFFWGSRGAVSAANFFGGRIYSGIVINRLLTDNEVELAEKFIAAKAGIAL